MTNKFPPTAKHARLLRKEFLKLHPEWKDYKLRLQEKQRRLDNDPEYIIATLDVTNRLEKAYVVDAKSVSKFFRRFGQFGSPYSIQKILHFLKSLYESKKRKIAVALYKYIQYSIRFGVVMRTLKGVPQFKPVVIPQVARKFHAKITRNFLKPVRPVPKDHEMAEYFEEPDLQEPSELGKNFDPALVNYFVIEDRRDDSLLKQIEAVAYNPDRITFIQHNAEIPFLFCLIGENFQKKDFKNALSFVTRFQHERFGRGAGRPRDTQRLKQEIRALQNLSGAQKAAAFDLAAKRFRSVSVSKMTTAQNRLSRLKRKIKQRRQ